MVILASCATWASTGRVVDGPCLHVGVRVHGDAVNEWATTLQVTTDYPLPCAAKGRP
jgi:hypothetical protein